MLEKTKNDELSLNASTAKEIIRLNFSYLVRISDIWVVLPKILGLDKFQNLDLRYVVNGDFDAFLIDALISFKKGESVNFTEIKNKILEVGDFSSDERLLLLEDFAEEFIWGYFHYLEFPE